MAPNNSSIPLGTIGCRFAWSPWNVITRALSIHFLHKFRTKLPLQLRTTAFSRLKELQGKLELAIATAKMSDGDRLGLERLKSCEDNSNFCRIFRNRLRNPVKKWRRGTTGSDKWCHRYWRSLTLRIRLGEWVHARRPRRVRKWRRIRNRGSSFQIASRFWHFSPYESLFSPRDSQHRTRSPTHFCDDKWTEKKESEPKRRKMEH